jgi:hypothetical protein
MSSTATYVLMAAFRLNPLDPATFGNPDYSVRDFTTVISETPQMIVANDELSINVSKRDIGSLGWKIELRNDSDAPEGFFVDMNTQQVDMNKSWRIRLRYPQQSYIQIKDHEPSLAWNSVTPCNRLAFDTLPPIMLKETTQESLHLWVKDERSLSTPFLKHSIVVSVPCGESMVFEMDLFRAEDINLDNKVDAADLAIVLGSWGGGRGDVNGDGTTDAKDQSLVLGAYTTPSVPSVNESAGESR